MRRYAIRGVCPSCRAAVLTGWDGEVAALLVTVDPTPLGVQGEALAQLDGRPTFELRRRGEHHLLSRRDQWQIGGGVGATTARPGRTPGDVLAEHRCGAPALPTVPSVLPPRLVPSKEMRRADPPF